MVCNSLIVHVVSFLKILTVAFVTSPTNLGEPEISTQDLKGYFKSCSFRKIYGNCIYGFNFKPLNSPCGMVEAEIFLLHLYQMSIFQHNFYFFDFVILFLVLNSNPLQGHSWTRNAYF